MRGIRLARTTDPQTSKDAAASLDPVKMTRQHEYILKLLRKPGTDEDIAQRWINDPVDSPMHQQISPSGLRTRRKELVEMGKVRDSGKTDTLMSGRQGIVWERVRDE